MSESNPSDNAVVIERTFEAQAAALWNLWTQPEEFKKWYGPQGFTIPVAEFDVQVGGKRFVGMSSPDGSMKMWTTGEHTAVDPSTRLSYTESMADENGNILPPAAMGMPEGTPTTTEVTVEFEDLGAHTKMVLTHAGVPADSPGASGWNQALDKLAAHLETV